MLRIAVVSSTFADGQNFVRNKFGDKIDKYNMTSGIFFLKNGDSLQLCYDENNKDTYQTYEFDAFIVVPFYHSLLDLIIHRQMRP
jgi:hypothetical protein